MKWLYIGTVLFFLKVINHSEALKCYACGGGESSALPQQQKQHRTTLMCDEFDKITDKEEKSRFIIQCPDDDYSGCITQIQGNNATRGCDRNSFDDCLTANDVTYCYCTFELCNGKSELEVLKQSKSPHHIEAIPPLETDDEDYADLDIMSGFGQADSEDDSEHDKTLLETIEIKPEGKIDLYTEDTESIDRTTIPKTNPRIIVSTIFTTTDPVTQNVLNITRLGDNIAPKSTTKSGSMAIRAISFPALAFLTIISKVFFHVPKIII